MQTQVEGVVIVIKQIKLTLLSENFPMKSTLNNPRPFAKKGDCRGKPWSNF